MPELVKYEAAVKALMVCTTVDEVKQKYRDKAIAMQEYAKQAKDGRLIAQAVSVRLVSERRAGELLLEMAKTGSRHRGQMSRGVRVGTPIKAAKLRDMGIDKRQSSEWQKLAAMKEAEFNRRLKKRVEIAVAGVEGNREVIKLAREERQLEKKKRRAIREKELGSKIKELPEKRYGVILADPAWEFATWSKETGMDRHAANHYTTQSFDEIKSLKVGRIAADDSVLFLWATVPMLPQALAVMKSWGFEYKTHLAWVTKQAGTGYWFRNAHELLLVGTRGDVPAPAMGEQFTSWLAAEPSAHSAKPKIIHQMIESYFPSLPKVELNARDNREGWDTWGNEAPEEEKKPVKTGGPLDDIFGDLPEAKKPESKPDVPSHTLPVEETLEVRPSLADEISKTYGREIAEGEILPPQKDPVKEARAKEEKAKNGLFIFVGPPLNRDVFVKFEQGDHGMWYGTSDEFKGILAAEKVLEDAIREAPTSIAAIAAASPSQHAA